MCGFSPKSKHTHSTVQAKNGAVFTPAVGRKGKTEKGGIELGGNKADAHRKVEEEGEKAASPGRKEVH